MVIYIRPTYINIYQYISDQFPTLSKFQFLWRHCWCLCLWALGLAFRINRWEHPPPQSLTVQETRQVWCVQSRGANNWDRHLQPQPSWVNREPCSKETWVKKRNCPLINQPLRTPHDNKSSHSGNFYLVLPIQAVLKYFKTNKQYFERIYRRWKPKYPKVCSY